MLTLERQEEIMDILRDKKSATVSKLAKSLYVSEATIRRDLTIMEKLGMLRRSHGGALLLDSTSEESSFALRQQENTTSKHVIASLARRFIRDGASLFIDSSSTVGMLLPLLTDFKYMTVITTGLRNAMILSQNSDVNIYIAGGHIQNHSNSILGSNTVEFISNIHADMAFLSCSGINQNGVITESNIEQSKVKQQMIKNAATTVLMCDSSKFGKTFLCKEFTLDDLDYLITDKTPDPTYVELFSSSKCQLLCP